MSSLSKTILRSRKAILETREFLVASHARGVDRCARCAQASVSIGDFASAAYWTVRKAEEQALLDEARAALSAARAKFGL